jgi:two-component system chemotaxis response regulator CheY
MLYTEKTIVPNFELPMSNYSASRRILVMSAEPVIRDLLERFLEIDGHVISVAADRSEGAAKALSVDLIVLDSDLAESGKARAQFRADAATSHLPVLWVGTRRSKENFEPPATAGADSVLPMPFTFSQISLTVSRLLGPDA